MRNFSCSPMDLSLKDIEISHSNSANRGRFHIINLKKGIKELVNAFELGSKFKRQIVIGNSLMIH